MSTVVGIFKDEMDALASIDELLESGYKNKDFSIFKKDKVQHSYLREITLKEDKNSIYKKDHSIEDGARMEELIFGIEAYTIIDTIPVVGAGPIGSHLRYDMSSSNNTLMESLSNMGALRKDAEIFEKSLQLGYILILVETSLLKKHQIEEIFKRHNSISKSEINPKFQEIGLDRRYKSALDEHIKERHPGVDPKIYKPDDSKIRHSEEGVDKNIHPEIDNSKESIEHDRKDGSGVDREMREPDNKHIRDQKQGVDKHMKHK